MVRSDGSFLPVEITNVNISKKERLAIVRDITAHCCQQGAFRVLQAGCETDKGARSRQGRAHSRRRVRGYGSPIRGS